ncbi:LOW QUALITY PROTEIN: RNA exonuclease 4 [Populus alba x Populus x berolinensis]|uniref:RNA exonuclease 4 n=1 Tax=Populus alba x Populus x berolinensis TaxID=444605 RepID=A0AAD6WIV3_9ROSI|nr:LOW QUALITY PROTEIN: RNA exonuclease 4 [Populus alba x Populus x berolinensis]
MRNFAFCKNGPHLQALMQTTGFPAMLSGRSKRHRVRRDRHYSHTELSGLVKEKPICGVKLKKKKKKKKMGSEEQKKKNPKKKHKLPINPNWAQLQQTLHIHGSRPPKTSNTETQDSILGKRKERPDAESDKSQINPLIPTNDDFSITDAIAMDCEMVGVGQGNRSALGRVTLVNQWGNVLYDEFVRPVERVADFRTPISGIRPRDLRKARDFSTAQKKVAVLIKGRILVGHALSNDLKALLLSHPRKDLRDTFRISAISQIEDARAAMLLYQRNKKEWEKSIRDQMRLRQKQKKRNQKGKTTRGVL